MDRKAWISIALCILGLIAWQWWYQNKYSDYFAQEQALAEQAAAEKQAVEAEAEADGGAEEDSEAAAEAVPTPGVAATPKVKPVVVKPDIPEQKETVTTSYLDYVFTNAGGGLAEVRLLSHDAENGSKVTVNRFGEAPIGAIATEPSQFSADAYQMEMSTSPEGNHVVEMLGVWEGGIEVRKRFILPRDDAGEAEGHSVQLEVEFLNNSEQAAAVSPYLINVGSIAPVHADDLDLYSGFDYYSQGKDRFVDVNWFTPSRIPLIGIQLRGARPVFTEEAPGLIWAAVKNQYFSTILSVKDSHGGLAWAERFEVNLSEEGKTKPAIHGAVGQDGFLLNPGESKIRRFGIYVGPNKYSWLKELGGAQEEVLRYGFFKIVSLTLLNTLNFFYSFLGSYALAIVALTIVIKLALWPLQNKATKSMRRMAALSPKMTELREKYKDDPTRMNQELMKLYKEYGVNPFGGCLPMLIQIPIFFGFYSMLRSSVELRNSTFLWVRDLSQPDTVFQLFGLVPINPLPLVMAASMFWQMKITPKTGDSVQQRIFLFMPLIFLVFCYNFASALALYWTVSNLFSIVQLYLTRDKPIPALTKVPPQEPPAPPGARKKKKKKRKMI